MTSTDDDQIHDPASGSRQLILNPVSGGSRQTDRARSLAPQYRFAIEETAHAGHASELAQQAVADGVQLLAVCGGDGTVHEVIQGLAAADALGSVTLCVIPTGTANLLATRLGIDDLTNGFELAARGKTRRLDIGVAAGEPFVVSAIAGLPAEASADASYDEKRRFGTLAFLLEGIQEARDFDGMRVEVHATTDQDDFAWSGDALAVLVGNLRRFTKEGGQADAEDGVLEVAIVKQMPPTEAVAEAIEQRLFQANTPHVIEFQTPQVDVTGLDEQPVTFSLDGEIRTYENVQFEVWPNTLQVRVGETYTPHPEHEGRNVSN